jgi:hypothetical protein
MADEFDTFLAAALAPEERQPDRAFTLKVNARIALEARLNAQRRAALRELGLQALAVMAIAGALLWLLRSELFAELAATSQPLTLACLLVLFGMLVALLARPAGELSERRPFVNRS